MYLTATLRSLRATPDWTGATISSSLTGWGDPRPGPHVSPDELLAEVTRWRDQGSLVALEIRDAAGGDKAAQPGTCLALVPEHQAGVQVDLAILGPEFQMDLLERVSRLRLLVNDGAEVLDKLADLGAPIPERLVCLDTTRRVLNNRSKQGQVFSVPVLESNRDLSIWAYHREYASLVARIKAADLDRVLRLELSLIPVTHAMRSRGILVDRPRLEQVARDYAGKADTALAALRHHLNLPELNPNSQDQLLRAFAAQGMRLEGTSEADLIGIDHPSAGTLQQYRQLKGVTDDARECLECLGKDGRLHPDWDPLGTDTGRYSCRRPALQSLSRNADLRACFVASPGHALLRCDLAAADLRPLAYLSHENNMIEAFRCGEDIHRKTVAALLEKLPSDVTVEERKVSKLVIFAVVYDVSPQGLCTRAAVDHGYHWTAGYAQNLIDRFFGLYPRLAQYRSDLKQQAIAITECRTITYHRRKLLPLDPELAGYRFRCLLNMPAQGTVADAVKQSMLSMHRLAGAHLVANFHDELVMEAPVAIAESVGAFLQEIMKGSLAGMTPGVPAQAKVHICYSLAQ